MNLEFASRRIGPDAVVAVRGEIDNATAPQLRGALLAALDSDTRRIVVDLSEIDFVDSSGLGALVGARKQADQSGATLVIVCPKPHVRRLFEISRLDAVLPLYDELAAATA